MADKKISELSQLGIASYADLFAIVDVSAYETKFITVSNLMAAPGAIGTNNASSGKFTTLQLLNGVVIDEISSDVTLSGNSDLAVPTERSVKTYVDNSIGSISSNHNDLLNIQGGTTNEYYHLTNERYTFLSTLTDDHNDFTNLQGGSVGEYYHLTNERYTFLSTLTDDHNDLSNLQGGAASEYYHLTNERYTFLSTLTDDHNDLSNLQGGGVGEYYHLTNERYTFLSTLTKEHNDLINIQGGDSTANEYYHLTNERYTFLSTLTDDHNDFTNLQGGSVGEYYHLTNERYTFLSTLTKEHNDLINIQGGDSTANEYYHIVKDIHDGLFSDTSILGIGNPLTTNLKVNYDLHVITGNINNLTELKINSNGLSLKTGVPVNRISNDGFFINNSSTAVVTERAIKTYVDNNSGGGAALVVKRVSTDSTAIANYILLVDTTAGDINVKLLDSLNGKITVKKISNDLNRVIITSTKKIDGFNEYIIYTPNQSYNFLVDSGDFFVI